MALTPEEVDEKRFGAVRLREGYEMSEVDGFLDEVADEMRRQAGLLEVANSEIAALKQENDTLRSELTAPATPTVDHEAVEEANALRQRITALEGELAVAQAASVSAPVEDRDRGIVIPSNNGLVWPPAPIVTAAEASDASRRLLQLATETAERTVESAEEDAATTRASARVKADEELANAHETATRLVEEAHQERALVLDTLETDRATLSEAIAGLKEFEDTYRTGMTEYFEGQLNAIRGATVYESTVGSEDVADAVAEVSVEVEEPTHDEVVDEAFDAPVVEEAEEVVEEEVDPVTEVADLVAEFDSDDEGVTDEAVAHEAVEVPAEEEAVADEDNGESEFRRLMGNN